VRRWAGRQAGRQGERGKVRMIQSSCCMHGPCSMAPPGSTCLSISTTARWHSSWLQSGRKMLQFDCYMEHALSVNTLDGQCQLPACHSRCWLPVRRLCQGNCASLQPATKGVAGGSLQAAVDQHTTPAEPHKAVALWLAAANVGMAAETTEGYPPPPKTGTAPIWDS